MKANIKILSSATNYIYLDPDIITNTQISISSKNLFYVYTTGSLTITFELGANYQQAIDFIIEIFQVGKGEISSSSITKTVEDFRIGDLVYKNLKNEHKDNPEYFNSLVEARVTNSYDITAIKITGGSPFVGSEGLEIDSDGDLTPRA